MRYLLVALLIIGSYMEWSPRSCTTDANCSLIYLGEIRGGY